MSFRFRMYLADGEDLDDYVSERTGSPATPSTSRRPNIGSVP